ncbi:DNA replication and repair protein RadC [Stigmatella aurantiaca]|uniref:DNA replication and repair protein RadC n=1 Tax=Stigmatella aurantiaca TaxID=41 RepID=A0A1H7GRN8_STIAU|nr:DNA repair protein RadC [Stigmatella aurantiaca]SEK40177.1 DNA replication and repair protein RadC [Stigmatella aurantiaca]
MERVAAMGSVAVEASAGEGSVRARRSGLEEVRERLFRLGASALTDPELLSVLLVPGTRAKHLAEALVSGRGGLKALLHMDPLHLCARSGLGPVRAAQVLAALEFGRRAQRATERRPRLRTPREIHTYLAPSLSALRREVFHVLCFNPRNVLLADVRVAEGTLDTCLVDPREVYAAALHLKASALVFAHNHPSGDPEPSAQDVSLTVQLAEAGQLLGIKVLDHLVLGDGAYVSLLERGLLPDLEGRTRWNVVGEHG